MQILFPTQISRTYLKANLALKVYFFPALREALTILSKQVLNQRWPRKIFTEVLNGAGKRQKVSIDVI